jgi:hypothetical protein
VNPALSAPSAPTVSATALDVDQALTVTGTIPTTGTPSYSWEWLVSINGGTYATATQCAVNNGIGAPSGALKTCVVSEDALVAGSSYTFELGVTDSASTTETQESSPTPAVVVGSALTAPAVPTVSATALDADQALTVSGTIPSAGTPTYSWQWLVSVNGKAYAAATQCAVNGGVGAAGGARKTCSIPTSTLTIGDTYAFELRVSDSSGVLPETNTSSFSSTATVNSALTSPGVPTPSASALDVDQVLTITGAIPSTGTSPYSWQWLVSVNGGAYVSATQCAASSGTGASGGDPETCTVAASLLTAGDTYAIELKVTDSASSPETQSSASSSSVAVSAALAAGTPTPASSTLDSGQSITLTATPSGGSGPYTYQWYLGRTSSACIALGSSISTAKSATYSANPTATTYYCYVVTDSATSSETQTSSGAVSVTVNSALAAPSAPVVSATSLNYNQVLTLTGTIPSTGTPTYSWQWLVSINGGAYAPATQCANSSGSRAVGGATETCSIAANTLTSGDSYAFELEVTDSATSPNSQTSAATSPVTVTSPSSSSLPNWVPYLGIALALIVIVLVIGAVTMRRRRPRPAAAPPMQAWQEEPSPPSGGAPSAAMPAYLETPEDVGQGSPGGFTVSPGGTASVATVPPAAEAEPNIDVLMAELDRISVDILKKPTKKGGDGQGEEPAEEDGTSS